MDSLLTWIAIGSGTLLLVASAVAWWEHRKRLFELKHELALAENSRFMLEEHVRAVDVRLHAMNATIEAHREALSSKRETSERRNALDSTLERMATSRPGTTPSPTAARSQAQAQAEIDAHDAAWAVRQDWPDTLPMVQSSDTPPHYEPTRPMDLPHR